MTTLNLDHMPSERSQVTQGDYKKFVYSPREKLSLQAGKKQATMRLLNNEMATGHGAGANEGSRARGEEEQQVAEGTQAQTVEQLVAS